MRQRITPVVLVTVLSGAIGCDDGTGPRPTVQTLNVTAGADVLRAGQHTQLTVDAEDAGGGTIDDPSVRFTSDEPGVALVDESGRVTGQGGTGTVQITATADAARDSVAIHFYTAADPCSYAPGLVAPRTVRSDFQPGDCRFGDTGWRDLWYFDLQAPRQVRVDLMGDLIDPFLMILDRDGAVLHEDDNGGDGTDARVTATFAAGLYFVVAHSKAGEGRYTLSVSLP